MKICRAIFSTNSQTEGRYPTSIVNIAKNLNRVALPIIATAAFASVLSVSSFDYNSCIAACNATALAKSRYDNCMTLCQKSLLLSILTCWNLCAGPFSNMEMSVQRGVLHLNPIN